MRIWIYRSDGSKFLGTFKNRQSANSWSKAFNKSKMTKGQRQNV